MNKKSFCIGNWKMNKNLDESADFLNRFKDKDLSVSDSEIIICPSFISLIFGYKANDKISFGAQNVSPLEKGSQTGEISIDMLENINCDWVIIGHSERRIYHNETNLDIKKKIDFAVKNKLSVIFCVGESLKTKRKGQTFSFLKKQINQSLSKSSKSIYIAYEPIWAIGSGLTPTVNEIAIIHKQIRKELLKLGKHYKKTKILYGGSVNRHNAKVFLENQEIDGLLLGGASLKYKELLSILTI